jgi:integrase
MTTRHHNDGLRKICACPRRQWAKCRHPWHFSFKWQDIHYRFSLDRYLGRRLAGKTEAEGEAERIRTEIRAGRFGERVPTEASGTTLETFAERFLERFQPRKARDRARWEYEAAIRFRAVNAHVFDDGQRLGAKPLGAITEDDLEAFMQALKARGRAASTRNHYVQHFRDVFRWAVKKGYLDRSPISADSDIRQEKPAKRERRLTADEDRRLLESAEASPRLYRLIIGALETGCRLSELLKLQWRHVHLDRRELVVRAPTAKNARHRTLPISARLASVLAMGQTNPAGLPFGPDAYVFGNEVGQRIRSPQTAWENVRTRADITDLRFHDLRHEAGSRFIEAGWPVHQVQEMLGHADLKQTSTYLNVTLEGLKASMRALDEARRCKNVASSPDSGESVDQDTGTVYDSKLLHHYDLRMERETGIEPATNGLGSRDSTTELLPPWRTA